MMMNNIINFSDEGVEELDKFLSCRDSELVSEFLRTFIGKDDLNNRQKVVNLVHIENYYETEKKEDDTCN